MNKPTILFLYNTSCYGPQPWLDDGRFNVVSVDYNDTDHSGKHQLFRHHNHTHLNVDLNGDRHWVEIMDEINLLLCNRGLNRPSLVISFTPCTDLAVSGAAHFAKKLERDPDCQDRAVRQAKLAAIWGAPYCVENPVSRLSTLWRKPDFSWHPWEFSQYLTWDEAQHPEFPEYIATWDRYPKKTCNWTGNGYLYPKKLYRPCDEPTGHSTQHLKLGGKSAKTKYIRSLTPRGWAQANYEANYSGILVEHYAAGYEGRVDSEEKEAYSSTKPRSQTR